jgi:streptogramin lyase
VRLSSSCLASFSLACLLCLVLNGCSLSSPSTSSALTPETGLAIQGTVYGAQNPIVGAQVYLFAAGSGIFTPNANGYGNASKSLLTSAANTTLDTSGGATNGDYYVTTGAAGGFTITGDYSCTPNAQVYLYALGGNPGSGTNSAAGLLAALGNCPSAGNFQTATPFIFMNEVSTIAVAYAFSGFATDATHVSSSGTALAQTGIANAFANAGNLATLSTGVALATTPGGNGAVPRTTINTLANILAACVNSTGPASSACTTLLADAKSGGTTGTAPTDTATAAINMAHNPSANIAALYALASATPPFSPALSAQPNDFTIGIALTGGGLGFAIHIAIDGLGNAWLPNGVIHNTVTEYSNLGAALSPSGGYTGGGLSSPHDVAIDSSGNAWFANGASVIPELNSSGSPVSSTGYSGNGVSAPYTIAIDGSNNVWLGNGSSPYNVIEISDAGTFLSGSSGYTSDGFSSTGMAIDGSGNVWMANAFNSLKKFNSSGVLQSGASGYKGGGMSNTNGLAVDNGGNVWITSVGASTVAKFSNAGVAISSSSGYTGGCINDPYGIAIDGGGNVWVANSTGNCITKLSSAGAILSGSTGYTGGLLNAPAGIAIDGSGDLWIMNENNSNVIEFIGVATPVITPIAAGLPSTPTVNGTSNLGTRP